MGPSRNVVRAIAVLHASVLPFGCWSVCNEENALRTISSDVERDLSGRLRSTSPPYTPFESCKALCEAEPGLLEFKACSVAPVNRDASAPDREKVIVSCQGIWADCRSVPSVSFGSGRVPEGYRAGVSTAHLSESARLESAAAVAFERLASELEAHHAPRALIEAAKQASEDERRHAALMGAVVMQLGGTYVPYDAPPLRPRPLLDVALENAREGVVNETLGAVLNAHQADHAEGSALRTVYASIAKDELAHARLSIRVHQWLLTQLPSEARVLVTQEMTRAIASARRQFEANTESEPSLGLPSCTDAQQIVNALSKRVWSACA